MGSRWLWTTIWIALFGCSDAGDAAGDAAIDARRDAVVDARNAQDAWSDVLDLGGVARDATRDDDAGAFDLGPSASDASTTPDAREADDSASACACEGLPPSWRCLRAFNRCATTVWLEAEGIESPPGVLDGRTELRPGGCRALAIESLEAGRLWGSTGCEDGACDTAPGVTPVTLAELTLGELDYYDLSLVDGFNLPMSLAPVEGTFERAGGGPFDCGAPTCATDVNAICPDALARRADDGSTVACVSGCTAFDTDELCCRGAHDRPETCPPSDYSRFFKDACPDAYSYAYDDAASTYTCRGGAHYDIVFCP